MRRAAATTTAAGWAWAAAWRAATMATTLGSGEGCADERTIEGELFHQRGTEWRIIRPPPFNRGFCLCIKKLHYTVIFGVTV